MMLKMRMAMCVVCLLVALPMMHGAKKKKVTEVKDVCTFDCMKELYAEFCGGATCVHSVDTEEELDAMCSDKCLDVILGEPGDRCLELNLPEGSDIADFQDFLREGIYEFCFNGAPPSEEAQSSEEAYKSDLYERQALDLVDADV